MTDETKLSEEQKQIIASWLDKHSPNGSPACPFCGSKKWVIADHLVAPPVTTLEGGTILGGTSYPQAMLISIPCGHTVFFNAVLIGVVKGGPEKAGESK